MSLYAVLEYNSVFSRAGALSPSIWTNMEKLETLVKKARINPDTVLYMDYGSKEIGFHREMQTQFEKMTQLLLRRKLFLTSRIVPFGNHCEASWEKQLPFLIHTLMYEA